MSTRDSGFADGSRRSDPDSRGDPSASRNVYSWSRLPPITQRTSRRSGSDPLWMVQVRGIGNPARRELVAKGSHHSV